MLSMPFTSTVVTLTWSREQIADNLVSYKRIHTSRAEYQRQFHGLHFSPQTSYLVNVGLLKIRYCPVWEFRAICVYWGVVSWIELQSIRAPSQILPWEPPGYKGRASRAPCIEGFFMVIFARVHELIAILSMRRHLSTRKSHGTPRQGNS